MDILIMYILMITDLVWTVLHHEEAGELNPIFERLLIGREVEFVYLKLGLNTVAALIVIYLRPRKKALSITLAIFGIIIYGIVVYLHWFVDAADRHAEVLQSGWLWNVMQGG